MRKRNCKLRDFSLQGAKINCARFSRKIQGDGQEGKQSGTDRHEYFVTGDNHNNVRFYQFLGEEELLSFTSNANNNVQSQVSAVAISWDQTSIFSGSNRGIINVWDVLEGKNAPICTLKGHATSVNCFGLFPGDQNLIASGSYDTQIKLWDHRQKNNFSTLKGHSKQINSIDISPDGSCLLSGSQDGTTKLWDIATQKVINTYTEHTAPVLKAIFHPQDQMFASCSTDRTAKIFNCDISKKSFQCVNSTDLVSMSITAIDFSPDGTFLCTGGNDILKIWHVRKNGLLVQSIDSAWKGVHDLLWCDKGIKGISSNAGNLSVWFCYLAQKKQTPQKKFEQPQLKLPKILKNPSLRRQSNSQQEQRKIRPAQNNIYQNKQQQNPKFLERNKDLQQVMNNVNLALGHLNNVTQMKNRQQKQKQQARKQLEKQKQRQRKQQEKIKEQQRKQRIRLQKQKERQQKQAKQRQRKQKIQRQKQQEQRKKQQRLQQLQKQRMQRERALQQKLHDTFQKNQNNNFQMTVENDALQNSSVMNISAFMGNGVQKQKLVQIQTIGELMKQGGRFESVYKMRSSYVKPIIHYWKQGKIQNALYTLSQADVTVAFDCISAVLHNSTFKMGITPDVACSLIKKLVQIMHNKHSTYVKNSMLYLNQIVLMFKDELIKVKMFNPLTRVDLSRQQRLAKYDRLTQQFLNVFKQERLKKYAMLVKSTQNQQLNSIAAQLYKNLQQVLRKIMPKKDAEAA